MAAAQKTGEKLSMEERYPRTISLELYDAWNMSRRYGDPGLLCKTLRLSRPVIDRALNFGHVKKTGVANRISKYFEERLEKEKGRANKMIKTAKS